MTKKICTFKELNQKIQAENTEELRIVLCHGHFNVIHPGHLRFLQYAHAKGNRLLVAITGHDSLLESQQKQYFSQLERATGVAALQDVDWVVILDTINLADLIERVRPAVYVLGKEFEEYQSSEIKEYIRLVKHYQGKVIFSSGYVHYASTNLLYRNYNEIAYGKFKAFQTVREKRKIHLEALENIIDRFSSVRLVVIGDTIVDQYIACDALGMSAEAPVIAVRELESKEFLGGAAIVAAHVNALGAQCHFISVVGDDEPGQYVEEALKKQNIESYLVVDENRPTTFKIRYMVDNQKLFRVSRLQGHFISKDLGLKIIDHLERIAPQVDGIIISDFVYGVISNQLLESVQRIAKKYNLKLFGDLQCSSQIGNVLKFKQFDFICPTERESRIALSDHESGLEKIATNLLHQTAVKNLLITLGSKGFVCYHRENQGEYIESQHFPALVSNPIDVTGAGDSLLSSVSMSLCAGASLLEASALGACVAAIAVNQLGNVPVQQKELIHFLEHVDSPDELI